jgi:hypothetical protein
MQGSLSMNVLRSTACILTAGVMLASVTPMAAPAFAQMPSGSDSPHVNLIPDVASRTPEQKEEDAIRDRAYKESLKKIPDTKGSSDPWGTVRAADAPKAAAPAPAKPRAKTGSAANTRTGSNTN